ncbi:kelch domain-containing protein 3 [Trichonephila inaurata madagascariensis]|uniref:Kelch domain-containing protein 3 n=1 Tax=Trichonephila inaurata madagascariensis TaxID=2747483 RepID=A0A8X7CEJ4_9ARAC|nr:kelch domain-containing protein 3 [Trichonephila inaurata madagascariensis]
MYWTLCIQRGGPQRVNHAAVAIESKIYTFGGYCSDHDMPQFTDVYCFDTISLKWSKINYEITPESPKACYGHSVVAYRHLIYLWGGQNITTSSNNLYCFNTKTLSWSMPETSGQPPKNTDGHSACVIDDYMYIFGGFEDDIKNFSNKTFRISLTSFEWQTIHTTGCPPSKRDFHTASVIDNCMYIFGGRGLGEESDVECYPNEIMYLDTNSMKWSIPRKDARAPCGRRSHTAVVYKGELYIIGGFDGINLRHLNDTFRYNPVSHVWTEMRVQGKPPCPRRRHCSVVVEDILYLFGGSSPKNDDNRSFFSEGFIYLREHSDLYVLDFFPTLKRLATINILENNIDTNCLPSVLQNEIKWIKFQPGYTYKRRGYSAFGLNLHS